METWVIDQGGYRIFKNAYTDKDEAIQKAAEAARILGRAIPLYRLLDREYAARNTHPKYGSRLVHEGSVLPDGSWDEKRHPAHDHRSFGPTAPAILGSVLDDVAEELESRGEESLAYAVDVSATELVYAKVDIDKVMQKLPKYAKKMLDKGDVNNEDLHDAIGQAVLEAYPKATKRDVQDAIKQIAGK